MTDFGLAKQLQGDSGLTGTGQILGTPSYMPPEQAAGKIEKVGPRSDVYAIGAILYCLVTGRPPFQAATPMDTLMQVLEQEPVPIRQLNAQVPRDLETIALKCLEKEQSRRYASARELSLELERYLNGEPIAARPASARERAWKWAQRKPALARLISAVAVLAAVLNDAAFTPDGRRLLTSSHEPGRQRAADRNGTVRLWDAGTGAELCTLIRHEASLRSVALSPDGRTAIVSFYGQPPLTRTWPVDFLSAARARRPRDLTPQERARFELPGR